MSVQDTKRYLIATHSFLVAVDLDANWQVQAHYVINDGHHYGIGLWGEGEKFLAKRPHSGGREVLIFETEPPFQQIGSREIERIGASHQMVVANSGLYIANTNYNSLVYESLEREKRHEFFFFGLQEDKNHVNSVFVRGSQIYVLLHNGLQYTTSKMAVLHHNLEQGFKLEAMLSLWHTGCHNIYVEEDRLLYNSSQTGELIVVDLKTEQMSHRLSFDGHTKGLSVTADHIAIGVAERASRGQRKYTNGFLAVMDRHTLARKALIDLNFPDLPHPIGNINEVRCLSEKEQAQSVPQPLTVEWQDLKLARRNPLNHATTRGRIWMWAAGKAVGKILRKVRPQEEVTLGE